MDGASRWAVDEQVPRLTLRGTAPPVLAGDRIIAASTAARCWRSIRATATCCGTPSSTRRSGRTELERLADIDSPLRVAGDDIFVVGFQGRVAMLALDSGQIWWARDASSYRGFTMDEENLYLTNSDSVVIAMRERRLGAVGTGCDEAPRPHRARASTATRWSSATSRAICTGSTRRPARSWRVEDRRRAHHECRGLDRRRRVRADGFRQAARVPQ